MYILTHGEGGGIYGVWAQMEAVSMPVTATRVPSATRGSARRPTTGRVTATTAAPGATAALSARASSAMGGSRVGRPLHRVAATSATARDQVWPCCVSLFTSSTYIRLSRPFGEGRRQIQTDSHELESARP
jgi:hypothetical protein